MVTTLLLMSKQGPSFLPAYSFPHQSIKSYHSSSLLRLLLLPRRPIENGMFALLGRATAAEEEEVSGHNHYQRTNSANSFPA